MHRLIPIEEQLRREESARETPRRRAALGQRLRRCLERAKSGGEVSNGPRAAGQQTARDVLGGGRRFVTGTVERSR